MGTLPGPGTGMGCAGWPGICCVHSITECMHVHPLQTPQQGSICTHLRQSQPCVKLVGGHPAVGGVGAVLATSGDVFAAGGHHVCRGRRDGLWCCVGFCLAKAGRSGAASPWAQGALHPMLLSEAPRDSQTSQGRVGCINGRSRPRTHHCRALEARPALPLQATEPRWQPVSPRKRPACSLSTSACMCTGPAN